MNCVMNNIDAVGLGVAVLVLFVMATLYVMRRRVRLGRRTPKF